MSKLIPTKALVVIALATVATIQILALAARIDQRNQYKWGSPREGVVNTIVNPGSKRSNTSPFSVTYIGHDGQPVTQAVNASAEFGERQTTRVWLGRSGRVFIETTGSSSPYVRWQLLSFILVPIVLLLTALCLYQEQEEAIPDYLALFGTQQMVYAALMP